MGQVSRAAWDDPRTLQRDCPHAKSPKQASQLPARLDPAGLRWGCSCASLRCRQRTIARKILRLGLDPDMQAAGAGKRRANIARKGLESSGSTPLPWATCPTARSNRAPATIGWPTAARLRRLPTSTRWRPGTSPLRKSAASAAAAAGAPPAIFFLDASRSRSQQQEDPALPAAPANLRNNPFFFKELDETFWARRARFAAWLGRGEVAAPRAGRGGRLLVRCGGRC